MDDKAVLRELAQRYREAAGDPVYDERRALWSRKNNLRPTRPLVIASFGMWNVWCREVFGAHNLKCQDPFLRGHEQALRMRLFQHEVGDDQILEPWITQRATLTSGGWDDLWGVHTGHVPSTQIGGSWKYDPPLKTWEDMAKLRVPHHGVDEADTARNLERLQEAVGEVLPVNLDRTPNCTGFLADLSTTLCKLRGLEQVMVDMYEAPEELHRLLAFMRDGVLTNQAEAEAAGDFSLTSSASQEPSQCETLEPPQPNAGPRQRKELWGYAAAQEFTLISPAMHEEFMLRYQMPILSQFALTSYGCCENLTRKIDMLRAVPNLRLIAVAPTADVASCAEQIRDDYVLSWRPNPANMICTAWDERRIRRILREGLAATRDCHLVIHLKDIETVQGDPTRLRRWVEIVRSEVEECGP